MAKLELKVSKFLRGRYFAKLATTMEDGAHLNHNLVHAWKWKDPCQHRH
jgi:hypothetical protein